ncbi:hypothetical protein CBW54_10465 [Yersinia kristensenii]|nr:hypothetical protein CBW54_10465 [Yersinia kristensenii]
MINKENLIQHLPKNGSTLIHCENGEVISIVQLKAEQFVATLPVFIEMAEMAGYIITFPEV